MNYCMLIQDKIVNEGDTIHISVPEGTGIHSIRIKVLNINPESQSFFAEMEGDSSKIEIPISIWEEASIIENKEQTDPNILFKHYGGRNDGQ